MGSVCILGPQGEDSSKVRALFSSSVISTQAGVSSMSIVEL